MEPRRLTADDIKHLVWGLSNLRQDQKEIVKGLLMRLHASSDGKIEQKELHQALYHLRESHVLTDLDVGNIESAVFNR